LLPEGERAALTAVYRDGMTVKQLAALRSSAARDPRSLRRQLRRTSARLLSPKFVFVAAFLEPADQAERRRLGLPCWPPRRRAVAEQCIVRGFSIREAAAALGLTFHAVRQELSIISALHEAAKTRGA
jgi:DNA-directed RNA polymerase specialized sigma24 family protein